MTDVSCLILITPDFHWEEQTFIKCEQTNLISVVSKLENLLTKLIFQFYSPLCYPLSVRFSCIIVFISSQNLIYYFFSELLSNFSISVMLSICARLCDSHCSTLVPWYLVYHWFTGVSLYHVSMYYPLSNFCSIYYTVTLYGITLYPNEKSQLSP